MKKDYFAASVSLTIGTLLLLFWASLRIPVDRMLISIPAGTVYTDRNSETLFIDTSPDDQYHIPLQSFNEIPEACIEAVLSTEDGDFFRHGAIDPPALARALLLNLINREIISGASTLTQQVSKIVQGNRQRTYRNKLFEVLLAYRLEAQLTKNEIFLLWSNRASFAANIIGMGAAAEIYFQKPLRALSTAQCAFLAAIPQNPSYYSPNRHPQNVRQKQIIILEKMFRSGFLSESEQRLAQNESVDTHSDSIPIMAPHFVFRVRQNHPETIRLRTSIESVLQDRTEKIIHKHLALLQGHDAGNAAAVIIENSTGAIRAYVGNSDYFDTEKSGKTDILDSYRQTGSTLKPFLYALAFRDLGWNANSIVLDEPIGFETATGTDFFPKNFDLEYKGELTVRQALAESRNIPAVSTLSQVGPEVLFGFLHHAGAGLLQNSFDVGLAGALGASEMKPLELAALYTMLAREGSPIQPCFIEPCFPIRSDSLIDRNIVREITGILADNTARIGSFGEKSSLAFDFDLAAKTGTTRNFRDNYTVGYTPEYTVLVWVGNADGSPMNEVSGISGAGPIFYDIMNNLKPKQKTRSVFNKPQRTEKTEPQDFSRVRIYSPLTNARYLIDHDRPVEKQKIRFEANRPVEFFLNDGYVGSGTEAYWIPFVGKHILIAKGEDGEATVEFSVER